MKVEILTTEVSIIRRTLIMIKVNNSIRDLFTINAEPDFLFTSGFVIPDNLIRYTQVLMNLSSAKRKISSHPDKHYGNCKIFIIGGV